MQTIKKKISLIDLFTITLSLIPLAFILGAFVAELFFNVSTILGILVLKRNKIKISKKVLYLFLIIFIYLFFSTFINKYYYHINNSLKIIFYFRFFLFFIIVKEIFHLINTKFFFNIYFLTIFILAFDVIFQYFFGYNLIGLKLPSENRVSSFFGSEYISGSFIVKFFLPLSLFIYFFYLKKKIILFLILSFFAISIILSGDKAPVFSLITILILSSIIIEKKFFYITTFFILIFLIFFLSKTNTRWNLIYNLFSIGSNKETIIKVDDKNYIEAKNSGSFYQKFTYILDDSQHLPKFLTAYKLWKDNIFIGTGINGFRFNCANVELEGYKEEKCSTHPHNYYLEFLSETGLIGLFLFIFCIILVFRSYFKKSVKLKKNLYSCLYKSYFINILSFLLILTTGSFFNNATSMLFWLNLTLFFSLEKLLNYKQ
jgi:hypothetical protein